MLNVLYEFTFVYIRDLCNFGGGLNYPEGKFIFHFELQKHFTIDFIFCDFLPPLYACLAYISVLYFTRLKWLFLFVSNMLNRCMTLNSRCLLCAEGSLNKQTIF